MKTERSDRQGWAEPAPARAERRASRRGLRVRIFFPHLFRGSAPEQIFQSIQEYAF